MPYTVLDDDVSRARAMRLLKRIFFMRQLGTILCFLAIMAVIWPMHYHWLIYALLAINAFVWPSFIYFYAKNRSRDSLQLNFISLLIDAALGGIWIALMGFNLVPSVIILSVLISDRYAAGGWQVLKPSLILMVLTSLIVWYAAGQPINLQFSPQIIYASLPLATIYMMAISFLSRELSVILSEKRRQFEQISLMDPRLQIPNRRLLEQRLSTSFAQAQHTGQQVYLILLDVDHFKAINDSYGHEVGDYILALISQVLKSSIGLSDIPARFGGDELAIIVYADQEQAVLELAHEILIKVQALRLPNTTQGQCTITVSIGIAAAAAADSTAAWFSHADIALYRAKHQGRNQVCFFEHFSTI